MHADLSEYNILYHDERLYIIDVSQSVEHEHPHAFDFLRKDISNMEDFFGRYGVKVLGLRRAFEFVTKENLVGAGDSISEEEMLERWIEDARLGAGAEDGAIGDNDETKDRAQARASQQDHEDAVFMRSYIPRHLNDLYDPERDVDMVAKGEGQNLIYANMLGLVQPAVNTPIEAPPIQEKTQKSVKFASDGVEHLSLSSAEAASSGSDDSEDSDIDDSESGEVGEGEFAERKPRGHRHEDKDVKKERKKAAKEEAREKRKHKMKKADKKKKVKASRH